jgi:septal ring factor EnvC (AmiA/AmiB activator)
MEVQETAKKNRFWIFVSAASLLVIIVLSYMIISAPDRTTEINDLKQHKALLEGQIQQIKKNNSELEEVNKTLEFQKDSLVQSMNISQQKIDKLNYDLKKALARINQLTDAELVNFFSDHFNGK